jgi:hypothetical protein
MAKARFWTCQRVHKGRGGKCKTKNSARRIYCKECGNPRAKSAVRSSPAHMQVLQDHSYEWCVENLNGGKHECAICGATGKTRRLHRDHEHVDGVKIPRGILCFPCNSMLPKRATVEWARGLVVYLEKHEQRKGKVG